MSRQHFGITGALSGLTTMLVTLLLTALFPTLSLAQRPEPTIYNASSTKYVYEGCYNETTGISGTNGDRALSGGIHMIGIGNMTVPMCLDYCGSGSVTYTYAGIEYSRECWCAQHISGLSVKFADNECDLGCDGNQTQTCGGTLKLTVYALGGAASMKAMPGILLLFLAAATAFNLF
ncbi:putative wsc domain-containing protein [Phaeoacremonium minimum UCRPA7]|uniref:Putative wsc domain-containing protein n=1 Tax=Phaeoacremonium minimum (strain UCR-PA7) TaxID=1286976 RepID=R8BKD9_PHAM7|nr:putative wsc domain-containing protein [Phaeoacremonium minimum UCRPA7]EON99677.1 putative wsc domain-containing protein [Phaeoacremonium minimum UCRPA7]